MKKILIFMLALFACFHAFAEESVPAKVGNAVKKGGEAAGHGIQKGGEAAVRGVETAAKWVEKKLHAGGEKSEKESGSK